MRGAGRIYRQKGSRFYWADYYDHGKRVRISTKTDRPKEATNFLIDKLAEVLRRSAPARQLSLFDLEQALLSDYKLKRQTSSKKVTRAFAALASTLGINTKKTLARSIRPDQLSLFATRRIDAGARPATVQNELALVKRAFNLVKDSDLAPPRFPSISIGDNSRRGFLEWADFQCIREHLTAYKRPIR